MGASYRRVSACRKKERWDLVVPQKPIGPQCLVCVFYSTGDSFHREENRLAIVSIVQTGEDAKLIADAIWKDYDDYHKADSWKIAPLKVWLPSANRTEEIYTGEWKGYFEHLSRVEIVLVNRIKNNCYE